MQNRLPQTASTLKLMSGDFASILNFNESQRRRIAVAQDPSLLFGAAVFAQMVAADLVRGTPGLVLDLAEEEIGADADSIDALVSEEAEGLFGALAGSMSGIAPALGGAAVLATVPGSGSDAGSLFTSGSGSNANTDMMNEEPEQQQQQGSVLARNASSVRNGGSPDADGAQQASPEQEAAGAQASAAETQQQFAGAGGANPFVPPTPSTPPTPEVPQAPTMAAQQGAASTEQAALQRVGGDTPASSSGMTFTSDAGSASGLASGDDIPLTVGGSPEALSSAIWPQTFAGAAIQETALAF